MTKIYQIYQGKMILAISANGKTCNIELTHNQFLGMLPVLIGEGETLYGFSFRKKEKFDLTGYAIAYGQENADALVRAMKRDYFDIEEAPVQKPYQAVFEPVSCEKQRSTGLSPKEFSEQARKLNIANIGLSARAFHALYYHMRDYVTPTGEVAIGLKHFPCQFTVDDALRSIQTLRAVPKIGKVTADEICNTFRERCGISVTSWSWE